VVLFWADSADEALGLAEVEARQYASSIGGTFTGYLEAYRLSEAVISHSTEVFSTIRETNLGLHEFMKFQYGTRHEPKPDTGTKTGQGTKSAQVRLSKLASGEKKRSKRASD